MASPRYETALIVGAGAGLSASLARLFSREGIRVALASRNIDKLTDLCKETGAQAFACDATDLTEVTSLFEAVERRIGLPDVVVFNASGRTRGPFVELVPKEVERSLIVSAFAGFLVAQQAARRMVPKGHGAILLTARRRASRDTPNQRRSRWASSPFAGSRRAWLANSPRWEFMSAIS